MFASKYFAPVYFAPVYFPQADEAAAEYEYSEYDVFAGSIGVKRRVGRVIQEDDETVLAIIKAFLTRSDRT